MPLLNFPSKDSKLGTLNMILLVQYREGHIATAEIVTRDIGLLERFYYDFIKHVKRFAV